jgi:hypothetical protein
MHETPHLEVTFGNHSGFIVFNMIKTPSAPIILGLSWLERYNSQIDWTSWNIEFPITPSFTKRTLKGGIVRWS